MNKICTSLEQSKKLLSLGLDPITADMMYREYETVIGDDYGYNYRLQTYNDENIEGVPCWSLAALLELMPLYNGTTPRLAWSKGSYTCFYYQGYSITNPNSIVDAAFEMVCWLIKQGHIKVNK